ncbi:dsDNA nuclease domain-containing protein [Nostoc sp. LEGE 12450]|uniref:dsDNA nuclease domain-containing protein n=1 Tax=Nostoc sp. LEGE 12450 TaxID=1828643 RepID=UPI00188001F6|nr:dsDNA nuclease domain-containing protein [Nostoc sp. LEGE 12450]MBE8989218.1 DUF4297 domain-containing protein [Nostoc sp. LEGE 12450]
MNESITPENFISKDPGDDIQRRFRYQAIYAAQLSLSLLEKDTEISSIYCEHHEDILVERVNKKFIGIQVKTRAKEKEPFKANEKEITKTIIRFINHDSFFSDNQFEKFIIAANCGFWDEQENGSNLQYLLNLAHKVDINEIDNIDKDLIFLLDNIAAKNIIRADNQQKTIIQVLKKIEIQQTSGLDDIESVLFSNLSKYLITKNLTTEQVEYIKEMLIAKCLSASSLNVQSPKIIYQYIFKNSSYKKSNLIIEAKQITKEILNSIISKVTVIKHKYFFDGLYKNTDNEIISPVNFAEDFDVDNTACNPKYFVGRDEKKEDFWNFISNVKDNKTAKRIICFQGHSGIGKSSLILKLKSESEEFYSNNVFIKQVDAKFAKTEYFGAIAIKIAIANAIEKGFIELPPYICDEIKIKENSLFLNQSSIKEVLKKIRDDNKVIVVFFDHFEHLLRQPRLEKTFNLFETLIHELCLEKANLVLGFSWTKAASLVLNEDIRYRWEKLREEMELFTIDEFVPKDAKNYIYIFKKYLKQKPNKSQELKKLNQLEEWILEECYAFPWLLRKLFTRFSKNQTDSQFPIKYQQISKLVTDMLADDLKDLHPREFECLQKIAHYETSNIFGIYEKEIKILIEKKLIIQSGFDYTVTSDILREYILTNEVQLPDFSTTYIPKRPVYFILEVFRMLETEKTKSDLINKLIKSKMISNNPKSRIIDNIISDLRHFFQVEYDTKSNSLSVAEDLLKLNNDEIADYLGEQLKEHLIIKEVNRSNKPKNHIICPGTYFNRQMLKDLLKTIYPDKDNSKASEYNELFTTHIRPITRNKFDHYTSRLLSWFYFAGIIEKHEIKSILIIPTNRPGKHKGKILETLEKEEEIVSTKECIQLNLF